MSMVTRTQAQYDQDIAEAQALAFREAAKKATDAHLRKIPLDTLAAYFRDRADRVEMLAWQKHHDPTP